MCWFQGENHSSLPKLNRECIKRWKQLNPDWEINVLSNRTIPKYVPEYVEIIKNYRLRKPPALSDLLRILLLSKYGGVWVDASVYPMEPLSSFYDNIVNETGFFTYRFIPRLFDEAGNRETVSWFLCVNKPNHYIIEKWKSKFINRFKANANHPSSWRYFTFHQCLTDLYDEDEHVKYIIDHMVQISTDNPLSGSGCWEHRKKSYMHKKPNLIL